MKDEYPKQYLYRQVVRAKLYIDEHFADSLDLENIADAACFSKYHFLRIFRKIYGSTPHQYLTAVRVKKAALLLAEGVSVKEACFSVGFESVGSFTGLFKRRMGVSPAAFQRLSQARKREVAAVPLRHIPNCFAEKKGWTKNSNFRENDIIDVDQRAAK
jgi:AraC-like DNA-binding protein